MANRVLLNAMLMFFLISVLLLSVLQVFGSPSDGLMEWSKTYGGTSADGVQSMVLTGDGGYALAGDTMSFGAGDSDFWLVRTDSSGNELWSKTYGGTGYDYGFSVVQTSDGGYALAGFACSFGAGIYDFWLIKVASTVVQPPTFSPVGGTYVSVQTVTISCSTSGATVRYTTDGSEPSATSTLYSGPFEVSSSMVVKARAFKDGLVDSDTATATYTIDIVTPSPNGSAVSSAVMYAAIITLVAAIVVVVILLLRESKHASSSKQYKAKPKLKKN